MWGAESQLHHYRKIEPCWSLALQSENAAHDPVPSIKYPFRRFVLPFCRRIFRWVEVPETVCFWLYDFNISAVLRVQRVTLRCNTVAVELAAFFVEIPIQLGNLQIEPRASLRLYGFRLSNPLTILSTSLQDRALIGLCPLGVGIVRWCWVDAMAALSVSQNRYVPPASV
jgi:hypothetical protein